MQNLPSKNTIIKYCMIIRNYCIPLKLTYCDCEDDYKTLKKNNISDYLIISCFQSIIFVIECKVIFPRYQKEIMILQSQDKSFDPSFILNNENIINFKDYCERSRSPNIDVKKYEYYKFYENLKNNYSEKIKELKTKKIKMIGGKDIKNKENRKPSINFEVLNDLQKAFYIFIITITPTVLKYLKLKDILNVYYLNPNIDIHTLQITNYIDLQNKKLIIGQSVMNIKEEHNEILKNYITDFNIQHEKLLFDLSRTKFSKLFFSVFNCSFLDYKKYIL